MAVWPQRPTRADQSIALQNLEAKGARFCALLKRATQRAGPKVKFGGNCARNFLGRAIHFDSAFK
jgi:hypothetical protein